MSGISAIYFLDKKGKPSIFRNYRGEVQQKSKEWPSPVPSFTNPKFFCSMRQLPHLITKQRMKFKRCLTRSSQEKQ